MSVISQDTQRGLFLTAIMVLSLVSFTGVFAGQTAAQGSGSLTTEVDPGESNAENTYTFAFNASEVVDQRSVGQIVVDFDNASGVDAAAISEDQVSLAGQDTGTPGVDATAEQAPGVLRITVSDTFTLNNENGFLNVTITGVQVPESGTFDSSIEFLDDQERDVIASDSSQYDIASGGGTGPASFDATITGTTSPVVEGNPLEITAEITNTGGESGTQTVEADVGQLGLDSKSVSLDAGDSTTETFSIGTGPGDAGSYTASVVTANQSTSTNVEVNQAPTEAPLTISAEPGESGVENTLTFQFNASTITDTRSVQEIRIDFGNAGVDVAAIAEDDITIKGQSTGTPSVDATNQAAPGVLLITSSDTFTLNNEGGLLNVTITGVTGLESGSFDGEIAFLDDQNSATIATGSDGYSIDTGSVSDSYTNANGVVETSGLQTAIGDWLDGNIETTTLQTVINFWLSGNPAN